MSRRLAFALAVIPLLAGCSSILAPRPDSSKFFVLTPAQNATPAASDNGTLIVAMDRVRLPGYLDRSAIATRLGDNQIVYSDNDRWAEPLEENFRGVLTADLAASLGNAQVAQHTWGSTSHPEYLVQVDVRHFECDGNRDCRLLAHYVIKGGKGGAPLVTNDASISRSASAGRATEAEVAALSATVSDLSDQIAAAVRGLALNRRTNPDQPD